MVVYMSNKEKRAVIKNAARMVRGRRTQELWVFIVDLFGVGSTTAHQIAKECGFEPHIELRNLDA